MKKTFYLKQYGNLWAIVANDCDGRAPRLIKTLGGIYTEEQKQNAQRLVNEMNHRNAAA